MSNILDNKRRNQIFDSFEKPVEVKKAYTEGIYADTPANRKLGRVGMSYSAYAEKMKKEGNSFVKQEKKAISTRSLIRQRWNPITIERKIKEVLPSIKGLHFEGVKINDFNENEEYYYLSIPKNNISNNDLLKLKNVVADFGLSDKNLKNYNENLIYLESPKWDENRDEVTSYYLWPSVKHQQQKEKEDLIYNERKLDECLSKIEELEKEKLFFKEDTEVLKIINKDINKQKEKLNKICPNYKKSNEYVNKILDTDERGKRISIPKNCVESIKFLLRFNGITSSEYDYEDTEKGHYISLI